MMPGFSIAHPAFRFCAYVLDSLIIFLFVFLSIAFVGSSSFYITMLDLIVKIGYFTYFAAAPRGATPGQLVFRLRVTKDNGQLLTSMESFDRVSMQLFLPLLVVIVSKLSLLTGLHENSIIFATQFVLSVAIISSYSVALFSKQNKTIYDILSDCVVVRSDAPGK